MNNDWYVNAKRFLEKLTKSTSTAKKQADYGKTFKLAEDADKQRKPVKARTGRLTAIGAGAGSLVGGALGALTGQGDPAQTTINALAGLGLGGGIGALGGLGTSALYNHGGLAYVEDDPKAGGERLKIHIGKAALLNALLGGIAGTGVGASIGGGGGALAGAGIGTVGAGTLGALQALINNKVTKPLKVEDTPNEKGERSIKREYLRGMGNDFLQNIAALNLQGAAMTPVMSPIATVLHNKIKPFYVAEKTSGVDMIEIAKKLYS